VNSRPRAHRFAAPATAVAALLALTGCATGSVPDAEGGRDTIRGVWLTDPTGFDPALAVGNDDFIAAALGFQTLLARDDNGIVGALASDYEAEPNRVTLTIREAQTCSDGTPITPTVVANSLARLADPATGASIAPLIFGPGDATVTGDDDTGTVTIDISVPYSDLLNGLTLASSGIICPAGLEDLEGLAAGTVEGANSGPYTLTEAIPGVKYTWTLRDDFDAWAQYEVPLPGKPAKTLEFAPGAAESVANKLATGDLDVAGIAYEELDRFEGDGFTINKYVYGDYFLIFNETETSPFTDPALRAAVAQAVDAQGFITATNPLGEVTTSVSDPGVACYNTDASLLQEYDPAAAAKVLDGLKIRLIGTNTVGTNGAGTNYIAESLRAAGADVELNNADNSVWVSTVLGPDTASWDVTLWASISSAGTLVNSLGRGIGPAIEDGGRNITRVDRPEATEPYNRALATTDPEEMCAAYQEAQEAVLTNVDLVPLGTNEAAIVTADGVEVRVSGGRISYSTLRIVE